MLKTFIIECDSEMESVFLYEAEKKLDATGHWIAVRGDKVINAMPDAKFYGILDSLIITESRMLRRFKNVPSLTPEPFTGKLISSLEENVDRAEAK